MEMEWFRGRTIAQGSTASVSFATFHKSTFAVKSTDFSRSETLQREQKILSSLTNPRVVTYKGEGVTSESNDTISYNLFMEYASGGSIADEILRQGGRLEESTIGFFTRQIMMGLDYLHSIGLAHCDMKGRNVLIGEDGVKIGDFGCAKWINSNPGLNLFDDSNRKPVRIAGTPAYMAPEVARGGEQGLPADVWAVGCTVIEMATGGSPWPGVEDPVSVLHKIGFSGETPQIPRFLSTNARDFLERCFCRDPKLRDTANRLLEHPFLNDHHQIHQLPVLGKRISNSPTTVLETEFWEDEATEGSDSKELRPLESRPGERIHHLASISDIFPDWRSESGEEWISVRSNLDLERHTSSLFLQSNSISMLQ